MTKIPMRRKDREITDFKKIIDIVNQCEIVHLGLASDDGYPYIVPVNFAYTVEGEQLSLYIHGALAGRKYEMLKKNPFCSFEMEINKGIHCIPEQKDVTTKYMCVMGKASAEFLEGEERQKAIDDIIMARYELTKDFDYKRERVPFTAVVKLTVTEWSGKSNIKGEADI